MTADSSGKYHASLLGFREAGLAGGTVIIKMHDSTGTSYSLARVAEVTATVTNASNPQETEIMPGDKVSLTFEGSYRGIYKYSGIFNPTTYNLFYSIGDTAYKTNVAQYQQMDQAKLELKSRRMWTLAPAAPPMFSSPTVIPTAHVLGGEPVCHPV